MFNNVKVALFSQKWLVWFFFISDPQMVNSGSKIGKNNYGLQIKMAQQTPLQLMYQVNNQLVQKLPWKQLFKVKSINQIFPSWMISATKIKLCRLTKITHSNNFCFSFFFYNESVDILLWVATNMCGRCGPMVTASDRELGDWGSIPGLVKIFDP